MDSAYEIVVNHMQEHLGIDPATVTPETTLEDLELDSLSILELALILQDETGLKRLDDGVVNFQTTVGQVAAALEKERAAAAASPSADSASPADSAAPGSATPGSSPFVPSSAGPSPAGTSSAGSSSVSLASAGSSPVEVSSVAPSPATAGVR
ncbi:acyl carrier protein [Actinoplanes sp. NPDC051851]|uniref:acyl carrier protein n=1 Tax=Actinoplanes sp. NPDC051851 TaxID=3154753 RepID=UPI0034216BD8